MYWESSCTMLGHTYRLYAVQVSDVSACCVPTAKDEQVRLPRKLRRRCLAPCRMVFPSTAKVRAGPPHTRGRGTTRDRELRTAGATYEWCRLGMKRTYNRPRNTLSYTRRKGSDRTERRSRFAGFQRELRWTEKDACGPISQRMDGGRRPDARGGISCSSLCGFWNTAPRRRLRAEQVPRAWPGAGNASSTGPSTRVHQLRPPRRRGHGWPAGRHRWVRTGEDLVWASVARGRVRTHA